MAIARGLLNWPLPPPRLPQTFCGGRLALASVEHPPIAAASAVAAVSMVNWRRSSWFVWSRDMRGNYGSETFVILCKSYRFNVAEFAANATAGRPWVGTKL